MAKYKGSKSNTGFKIHAANETNDHFMNDHARTNVNKNVTLSSLNKSNYLTKRYTSMRRSLINPKLKRVKRQSQSNVTSYTSIYVFYQILKYTGMEIYRILPSG